MTTITGLALAACVSLAGLVTGAVSITAAPSLILLALSAVAARGV